MDDPELERIRQQRMQQLMAQQGGGGQYPGGEQQNTPEAQQQQQEQRQAAEERRQAMLSQILLPAARERMARIALVKPDKAQAVENLVIQLAQRGQLSERVSEDRLIGILEQVNQQSGASKPRVTIQRRRAWDDD